STTARRDHAAGPPRARDPLRLAVARATGTHEVEVRQFVRSEHVEGRPRVPGGDLEPRDVRSWDAGGVVSCVGYDDSVGRSRKLGVEDGGRDRKNCRVDADPG